MKFVLNLKMFFTCLVAGLSIAFASSLPSAGDEAHLRVYHAYHGGMMGFHGSEPQSDLQPSAKYAPEQVIKIQLDALRQNDNPSPDSGIRVAFRFARKSRSDRTH